MNASISPLEVASKQAKGAMIWPPGIDLHRESPAAHLADEVPQLLG